MSKTYPLGQIIPDIINIVKHPVGNGNGVLGTGALHHHHGSRLPVKPGLKVLVLKPVHYPGHIPEPDLSAISPCHQRNLFIFSTGIPFAFGPD